MYSFKVIKFQKNVFKIHTRSVEKTTKNFLVNSVERGGSASIYVLIKKGHSDIQTSAPFQSTNDI